MSLSLARRRVPLLAPSKLSAELKAQLKLILASEGAGSITAASKDPEWRSSVEVVDVCDEAGETLYQLWAWPSGSAVLYRHGTTEEVASAAQHALVVADAKLRAAMKGALAGASAAGLVERVEVTAPAVPEKASRAPKSKASKVTGAKQAPGGEGASGFEAALAAARSSPDRLGRNRTLDALVEELFGKPWRPYPKRAPSELTAEQRALVEAITDDPDGLPIATDLHHHGLVSRADRLARYLGRTSGPADVVVEVEGRSLPLWVAVTNVGSGDLEPELVMASFQRLPKPIALAAWGELARGEALDIDEVHPRSMAESGIPRTPANVKHRTRLFGWLADAGVWLGEPARAEAERILSALPEWDWGHRAFVAVTCLTRWAKTHSLTLDSRWDPVVARLHSHDCKVYATPLLKEIVKSLPKERQAAVTG